MQNHEVVIYVIYVSIYMRVIYVKPWSICGSMLEWEQNETVWGDCNCYRLRKQKKQKTESKEKNKRSYYPRSHGFHDFCEDATSCLFCSLNRCEWALFYLYLIRTTLSLLIILTTYAAFIIDLSGYWHAIPPRIFHRQILKKCEYFPVY